MSCIVLPTTALGTGCSLSLSIHCLVITVLEWKRSPNIRKSFLLAAAITSFLQSVIYTFYILDPASQKKTTLMWVVILGFATLCSVNITAIMRYTVFFPEKIRILTAILGGSGTLAICFYSGTLYIRVIAVTSGDLVWPATSYILAVFPLMHVLAAIALLQRTRSNRSSRPRDMAITSVAFILNIVIVVLWCMFFVIFIVAKDGFAYVLLLLATVTHLENHVTIFTREFEKHLETTSSRANS
ncbi:hypothetical protein HDU91_001135 [Kappamyces sp. JEL0680]|nr:hypothetical protein HDU91_001135 [Kappamyces sp. JEL0680]